MLKSVCVLGAVAALGLASSAAAQSSWTTNTTTGTTTYSHGGGAFTTTTRADGTSTTTRRTFDGSFSSDGSSKGRSGNMTWSTSAKGQTKTCYKSGNTKICS